MRILSLDMATQCGWAVSYDGCIRDSGSKSFHLKGKLIKSVGMKFLRFEKFLDELNHDYGPFDAAFFEQVTARQPSTKADQSYGGFQAVFTSWCEKNSIPYEGVAVSTNKKFATGKKGASKKEMIEAAQRLWFDPIDDNEADAIHVLNYAINKLL